MQTCCAIILDYFGSSKTIACLTSLLDQGLDSVMIVDNSGDRQANIQLQEALNEFSSRELPFSIHQIVNPKNLGYAAGVNNALHWLERNHPHSFYLLINNDTEVTSDMLQQMLNVMRKHDKIALTAPLIDVGQKKIEGYWYHRFTALMFSHPVVGAFRYLTGCCLLVNREIIGSGLFDEDFFMYGEDIALDWRLRQAGWETICVKDATIKHEGVGSSRQGGFFYEYHMAYGHLLLANKLVLRPWEIPFLYLGHVLGLSIRSIARAIRYRSIVPVKAYIAALRKIHNPSLIKFTKD